jgi:hypothetical protein
MNGSEDVLNMTAPSSAPLRKGRLLIVDDDLNVLRAVSKALQRQGYDTQECASGAKALTVRSFFFTLPCTAGMSNPQLDDDRSSSDRQGS